MTVRGSRANRRVGMAPWAGLLAMLALVGCGDTGKNSGKDAGDAGVVRGGQDGGRTDGQGTGERMEGDATPEDARTLADTRADLTPDSLVVVPDTRIEADTAIVDAILVSDTPVVPPDTSLIVDAPLGDAAGSGTGGTSGTIDARGGADGTASSTAGSTGGAVGASSTSSGAGGYISTCGAGNHNGGDGTCVPVGTCSNGYHLNSVGGCVANMDGGSGDAPVDAASDAATDATQDAPIEVPQDATRDTEPAPKLDAPLVCPPGRMGADCQTCLVHVKTQGLDSNDGTTWTNAIKSVQQALTMAAAQVSGGAAACEIWVAAGTYKPTDGADRTATFLLRDKVGLYGGFAGSETRRSERVPGWLTTLSGDVGKETDDTDNSYHVVTGATGATLDGFTITGGNASEDSTSQGSGGGMYNEDASPTITNCIFSGNSAQRGGGMAIFRMAPTLINCTFANNTSSQDGGGVYVNHATPTVTDCTFIGNSGNSGGGLVGWDSSVTVTGCTFTGNHASNVGGGMCFINASSPVVTNCTFTNNTADFLGGGMHVVLCTPTITNSTFVSNSARAAGGLSDESRGTGITNCTFTANSASLHGGGILTDQGGLRLTNTILWNNSAPEDPEIKAWASLTVSHSIVKGGFDGDGNLALDPKFVSNTDLHLQAGSPAIDQGSDMCPSGAPATDKDGNSRWDITKLPNAAGMHGVDIGAYELQSSDATPGTPVPALCPLPAGHWYLGDLGQSCEDVCAAHGGYDSAATIGIGSGAGDMSNSLFWTCAAVLNHLGAPATPVFGDAEVCLDGFGCEVDSAKGRSRCVGPATTARAGSDKVRRACACVN